MRRRANSEKNIFLKVEYLGKSYFGFQVQARKSKPEPTVQVVLERALIKLFRKKIRITYASRTDRGVHAQGQTVNFKVATHIPFKNIKTALNTFLPSDIRIKQIKAVPLDFHARFSAKAKRYRYIIRNSKAPSVFWQDFSWQISGPLNLRKMQKVSQQLIGKHNFYLFAKEARKYKDCIRTVKTICLKKRGNLVYIDIEASGFLRNMARNIVSFLIKVGIGKLSLKQAKLILERKISYVNKPAPASGLYLYKVFY